MGTRCLTVIHDERDEEIAFLYRQFDGYPEGHGKELKDFLKGIKIINGIQDTRIGVANGANCLAAQIVAHFKTEVGQFYLYPAKTRDCGEDYIYHVRIKGDKVKVNVE